VPTANKSEQKWYKKHGTPETEKITSF